MTLKAHKAIIQGTNILVFSEAGTLLETVDASKEALSKRYGFTMKSSQWEDEIIEQWYHGGLSIAEPRWDEVRKDLSREITAKWSYSNEETV